MEHVWDGVLSQSFFCTSILHMCSNESYMRATLQSYQARTMHLVKPLALESNSFADDYYEASIRGKENTLQDYKILHLSDLWVDLNYVAGASTQCRDFRCCHANSDGEIDFASADAAGPYGSRGCDTPLGGARSMLTQMKEKVIEKYDEINIVVVTGNLVSA